MAVAQRHDQPVSNELVRKHAEIWHGFTQFMKASIAIAITVLILMAILLL
ncbi:MAG TPA: hypothetical protein VD978_06390 [Azospirillum sp.]|nr:hypothetical protein [Azospirillum sp.]